MVDIVIRQRLRKAPKVLQRLVDDLGNLINSFTCFRDFVLVKHLLYVQAYEGKFLAYIIMKFPPDLLHSSLLNFQLGR